MNQEPFSPSVASRDRVYAMVALAFFLLSIGLATGKAIRRGEPFDLVTSDGRFYYAYLPSVLLDRDLDFTNQITEHWGPDFQSALLQDQTSRGLVQNKYPIGLALTLAPAFLLGHVIALLSGGMIPANGYSFPYQVTCLALIELLVWRTFVRCDRLLTDRLEIPPAPTLTALLVIAIGTPYAYYACREPFMVHAVSTFWCTEIVAIATCSNRTPLRFWLLLGSCGGMAIVCRPTNLHLLPVAIAGAASVCSESGLWRTFRSFPLAGIALLPIGIQSLTWSTLYGQWIHYSYGEERFNWTQPALWQTLFSSRHGLFFWSPVLLLAVVGLFRVRHRVILCWILGGLLLWYANSAWHCWWFGDAYGARAFLELSGLFGVGLALFFQSLRGRSWLPLTLAILSVLFNLVLMALYVTHAISRSDYLLR